MDNHCEAIVRRKFRFGYLLAMLAVILLHSLTATFSPMPWMDEVQIVEMGRNGVLDRTPQWSMIVPNEGGVNWTLYYVGGLLEELGYRLFGGIAGPRFVALLGLGCSNLLLMLYLKRRRCCDLVVYGVPLVLLVDPVLTQSVRGARVDVLATCCVMFSLLSIASLWENENKKGVLNFFLAGAASVAQLLIWPSSVLQLPVVLAETWFLAEKRGWRWRSILGWAVCGLAGAAFAFVLLLAPLGAHLTDAYQMLLHTSKNDLHHSLGYNVSALLQCAAKTPMLCLAGGLLLLAMRRNIRWAIFWAVALVFVLATRLYVYRFVHLLPFFVLGLAFGLNELVAQGPRMRKACLLILGLAVAYGFTYSVALRNATEFAMRGARSQNALVETLTKEVGPKGTKVYVDTFQPYYAGREIGWLQYRMEGGGLWWQGTGAQGVLADVDFFLAETELVSDQAALLEKSGFFFQKKIVVPWSTDERVVSFVRKAGRPLGYGPYYLYKKRKL